MEQYYYSTATGQSYSASQMQDLFGINTEVMDLGVLNLNGFFPVQPSSPDFDLNLYTATEVWNIVSISGGQGAIIVWSAVPRSLSETKFNGTAEVKQQADESIDNVLSANFLTSGTLASVASQNPISRPAFLQSVLDETVAITEDLSSKVAAIAAATTVDEVNNIVNPPYGEISTSRTGNDFNDSYYVTFYSASLTEADTELFIPATSTVISYILPTQFNAFSEAFTTGNYLVQIRETATGRVLADFICPEGAAQVVSY